MNRQITICQNGFTLMELVLVIAILGIIAGLGIGNYANFLRQGSLDSAANEIVAKLREAQTKAQASGDGTGWGVYFDTTNKDRYILFKGNCSTTTSASCYQNSDCSPQTCANSSQSVETNFLNSSVEVYSATFGSGNYVPFDRPTGKPTSGMNGSVVIQLKGGSQQKTINVSALGKIE